MVDVILVYLDDEDIEIYKKVSDAYVKLRKNEIEGIIYTKLYSEFYEYALNKYGILKNKQWYIDPVKRIITEFSR